jgi:tetratricopeptide (TPR) repeat protein
LGVEDVSLYSHYADCHIATSENIMSTRRLLSIALLSLTLITALAPITQAKPQRLNSAAQEIEEGRFNIFNNLAESIDWSKADEIDTLRGVIAKLDRLIQQDPDFGYAYLLRGTIKSMLSESAAALADHNKAISLLPTESAAYHLRGIAHHKQGNTTAAIADYTQAIQRYPNLPKGETAKLHYFVQRNLHEIYQDRSQAHRDSQNFNAAIADLNKVVELTGFESPEERADLYVQQGDRQAALIQLTQAIKDKPNNQSPYIKRAQLYRVSGDFKAAAADYAKAIELIERAQGYGILVATTVGTVVRSQQAHFLENSRFVQKIEEFMPKTQEDLEDSPYRYSFSQHPTTQAIMVIAQPNIINTPPAIGLIHTYKVDDGLATHATICVAQTVNNLIPKWEAIAPFKPNQKFLCPRGYQNLER